MAFKIPTRDVSAAAPLKVTFHDRSGAHIIAILVFRDHAHLPITQVFVGKVGSMTVDVEGVSPGVHPCTFVVQAFRSPLNGMYDTELEVDGQSVGVARGNISKGKPSDVGSGDFNLTV